MDNKSNFDIALKIVLKHEGGYSNIAEDHGGPTNWGITQHDLAVHRGHQVTAQDVKDMTVNEAGEIYKKRYWSPYHLDDIWNVKLATILFDQGVLCGPLTAIKLMQRCLNIPSDGIIGPQTIKAINGANSLELAKAFLDKCDERYQGIVANNGSQKIFLKGWLNRTADLRRFVES